MKRLKTFGKISSLLLVLSASIALASCQTSQPITVQTVSSTVEIPIQQRPRPVNLNENTKVFVVTIDNLDEFLERFAVEVGDQTFYAISVNDYETLLLNLTELRRYIQQQGQLIVYYENAINQINASNQ